MKLFENAKYLGFSVCYKASVPDGEFQQISPFIADYIEVKTILSHINPEAVGTWNNISIDVWDEGEIIGTLTVPLFHEIFNSVDVLKQTKKVSGLKLRNLKKYSIYPWFHCLLNTDDWTEK